MKRAVITGLGIVSSIGNDQKEVVESLKQGKSGIAKNPEFAERQMRSQVAGLVNLDYKPLLDRKSIRFMGDAAAYAAVSMQQAIADAQLSDELVSNTRTGVVAGSGGASSRYQVIATDTLREKGVKRVGAFAVPKTMSSSCSANLATMFKIKGINYSISSACATSAHCIGHAVEQIQLGKQDIVFAGGGEEITWEQACLFDAMGALSSKYNETPEVASRAYDTNRDGFVYSGGGGILVIEELEHALARGAKIYAEVTGYGATSDGEDMVAPNGEGAARCMKMALSTAKNPVEYINAHGTSTPVGDSKELEAIKNVFTDNVPPVSATKSMTGHALGAAGVHEAVYSLLMLEHGFIAPSINIEIPDASTEGVDIVTVAREQKLTAVMSNSFGFGGTNATLIFEKFTQ